MRLRIETYFDNNGDHMASKNKMTIMLANTNQQYIFNDLSDDSIKIFKLTIENDDKFITIDNNIGSISIAKNNIIAIEITKQ